MTDIAFNHRLQPARRPGLFDAEPLFAASGLLIGLSLAPTLAAMALDPRQFLGENVWLKPVKFQIALTLYLLTLAFFAIVAELIWVSGAAMYGTASHFNVTNPLLQGIYGLMGLLAVLLTSATLVHGIAIWRNPRTGLDPALHLSIALGLVLTMPGHLVGTPLTGATVPVIGWSREVGDLRAPHFVATHAMHTVPVAGWLAVALLPPRVASPAVWGFAVLFTALVTASFAGALAGLPLIPVF